jgi:hypothetical protein
MPILKGTRPTALGKIRTDGAFNDSARFQYTPGEEVELLGVVVGAMPGAWATAALKAGLTSISVYRSEAGPGNEVPNLSDVAMPGAQGQGERLMQITGVPVVRVGGGNFYPCSHIIAQGETFTIAVPCAVSDDGVTAMVLDVTAYPVWRRTKDATIPYRAI